MNEAVYMVFIYTLADPITGEIRYVGKAIDMAHRYKGHLKDTSDTHKARWVMQLTARGLKPIMEALEVLVDPTEEEWKEAEQFWIESLKFMGFRLTNLIGGGLGVGRHSEESKLKMSKAHKNLRPILPETRRKLSVASKGRQFPEEAKKKLAARFKGIPLSKEHCDKLKAAWNRRRLEHPTKESTRRKIAKSQIGRHHSLESRIKMSKAMMRRPASYWEKLKEIVTSDGYRRKMSEAINGRKHSASARRRMSAVQTARREVEAAFGGVVKP